MFYVMERRHLINGDIRLIITPHPRSRFREVSIFSTENTRPVTKISISIWLTSRAVIQNQ